MLNEHAHALALALHGLHLEQVGVGPDARQLAELTELTEADLRPAINELASLRFIFVDGRLGSPQPGIPNELRDVAGVQVLEPLHEYVESLSD